ncbi:hypothetical protein JCM10213v2_000794 [Rhodosporidiobolus nylandii]
MAVINLWRPLKGPVTDSPLAVCDARTARLEDLEITTDVYGEGSFARPSSEHRFWYLRDMMPDELLLLRCFDSTKGPSEGGTTIHSAFFDEARSGKGWPLRESIEVRTLVNSHEVQETYSVKDRTYSWTATDASVDDEVQVWIYDSSGKTGKTGQIKVVDGSSSASKTASKTAGNGGSKTSGGGDSGTTKPSGEAKSSAGGSGSGKSGSQTGSAVGSKSTGGASGDDTDESSSGGKSGSGALSTASSGTLATGGADDTAGSTAAATAAATQNQSNVETADFTVGASSGSSISSSGDDPVSTTSSKTGLYLGIGAVVLAVILSLALFL